jgi:signal transduction histidine kinase
MTLLKPFMVWATGSDLSNKFKRIRLQLLGLSILLLSLIVVLSAISTITSTSSGIDEVRRRPYIEGTFGSGIMNQFQELERLRRNDTIQRVQDVIIVNNLLLAVFLTMLTWFMLYFILKPLSDEVTKREQFLSYASHELRTPLAILKSELQLLEGEKDNKKLHLARKSALGEIDRLNDLSTTLLSTLSNNQKVVIVNLVRLITDINSKVQVLNERNISVSILEESKYVTSINKDKLYLLLSNIIDNLYRYSTKESTVTISIHGNVKQIQFQSSTNITTIVEGVGMELCRKISKELGFAYSYSLSKGQLLQSLIQQA